MSRSDAARRIARCLAARRFKGHWDLPAILNDAESVAFELETTAPVHAKSSSIGYMAVKRIAIGRQFNQSVRSITTRKIDRRCQRPDFRQVQIKLKDLIDPGAPPSEAVPGWLDYQDWLSRHDARRRGIAEALAMGSTTSEVADQYGVSEGRISQMRRGYMQDWQQFQTV